MVTQQAESQGAQSAQEVSRVISRAAYFSVYSLPDYSKPEVDNFVIPNAPLTTYKSYNVVSAPSPEGGGAQKEHSI